MNTKTIKQFENSPKLICNAIRCPDGTILRSRSQHDYVEHTQKDGRYYAIDGGLSYIKTCFADNDYTNMSVYSNDKFELVRYVFEWGSYGQDGKRDLQYLPLMKMSNIHIENILKTQKNLDIQIRKIFEKELVYRQKKRINITNKDRFLNLVSNEPPVKTLENIKKRKENRNKKS